MKTTPKHCFTVTGMANKQKNKYIPFDSAILLLGIYPTVIFANLQNEKLYKLIHCKSIVIAMVTIKHIVQIGIVL